MVSWQGTRSGVKKGGGWKYETCPTFWQMYGLTEQCQIDSETRTHHRAFRGSATSSRLSSKLS
jgi:hypothetical protein